MASSMSPRRDRRARAILLMSLTACLQIGSFSVNAFSIGSPQTALVRSRRSEQLGASSALQSSVSDEQETGKKMKLSRPERKALERALKQKRASTPNRKISTTDAVVEPSEVLLRDGVLDVELVLSKIKKAQTTSDIPSLRKIASFLLEEGKAKGLQPDQQVTILSRLVVATLNYPILDAVAVKAVEARKMLIDQNSLLTEPMQSAAILRGYLRNGNETEAIGILENELPVPEEFMVLSEIDKETASPRSVDFVKHRALSLASFATRYFLNGNIRGGLDICQSLSDLGPIVRACGIMAAKLDLPWLSVIQAASKCESLRRESSNSQDEDDSLPCNVVYSVLNSMTKFPSDARNDDRVYEALSNALVRRILFVTGAVDMAGCPPADRGEAVFIGRSNVGKSSLINMITNRKAIAFTSKRPGKTQQFNYFTVNDKPGREKEFRYGDDVEGSKDLDSFYLVDLPGFGYAKVPEAQRQKWSSFMSTFLAERPKLRVVFHLIDGRHGPIDEDLSIMERVGQSLSKNVAYVVVLTKADKNVKKSSTKNPGKVSENVMTSVKDAMREAKVGNSPVILTSSETKLGRDDLWRYISLAADSRK